MNRHQVIVGTRRGVYPIHKHWLDTDAQIIRRWRDAGGMKAPRQGGTMLDLHGVHREVPWYDAERELREEVAA